MFEPNKIVIRDRVTAGYNLGIDQFMKRALV